ncbi:KpsF/GutQ family sugar-phosphate isomerase [uncultured Polaribacter sp.]|uniref:KpsF/GutQ family sugar-phosphate isomerase n=1 Tax=uncultured Polaribacter sp. TaxID=174711 RepID=UPI0026357C9A|nr:KpsF/GutQ family sugar-phosphate isomerase [uncultured Polaribacter sp.]
MKNTKSIIATAKKTILIESKAIANLSNLIGQDFEDAVTCILNSKGRVIVTGIGKSANIATKIVATFNSTGTPAIFMHAADAIHGDLGNVQIDDVVICLSKSGNTPEIKVLLPLIKNYGNKIIAITGNTDSYLGEYADFTINAYVDKEACTNNLAPTTSTTAQLVLGDALAVCLLNLRGFTSKDFAKYHPGGALGKKLYLRVSDLVKKNLVPKVKKTDSIAKVILEISEKRLGATAVVEKDKIIGIVTDGDIRRMLSKTTEINQFTASEIMGTRPKFIDKDAMAVEALELMENNSITQLLVVDNHKNYEGVIHLHDLIKEGIF